MDYQQLLKKSDEEHKQNYKNNMYASTTEDTRKNSLHVQDLRYTYSNLKKNNIYEQQEQQEHQPLPVQKKTNSEDMDNKEENKFQPHTAHTTQTITPYKERHHLSRFSKKLIQCCIQNLKNEIVHNYTYEALLVDMYIIDQSQLYNNQTISIYELSYTYKVLFIVYSIIYNQTIYIHKVANKNDKETIVTLTDIDIINVKDVWLEKNKIPEDITDKYNDILKKKYVSVTSKIVYYNHSKKNKVDWEDVFLFTNECIQNYKNIIDTKQTIHLSHLQEIYYIYFIPTAIILNKKLMFGTKEKIDIHTTFTIGDYTAKENKNILIMNKYSNTLHIYYDNSLFFNYTINQFIIHSIKLKNEYMLGRLYAYISIRNNILYYKQSMLQLPSSYVLKKNILYKKKKKKNSNNINQSNTIVKHNKFHFNHKSKRLLSITIKQDIGHILTNKICNRIYTYILLKFPICSEYTSYSNLENIYLFNNEDINDAFINNSLFSMNFLIKKKKIIISYSECMHNYIQSILLELNNMLDTKKIHLVSDNQIIEYIVSHSNYFQYIFSNNTPNKMNIVEFLKKYGFCTIKTLHIYYYKYYNSLWSKKDVQHSISMSNRIKKNPKSLNLGNHILIEFELDIGVSIIIERAKQLVFYVKEHAMNRFKEKKIKIKKVNTYTDMDKIDQQISMIDLFLNIYKQKPDFIYFTTKFNCSSLALLISKNLLKHNVNEYIKLQNKLENATNIDHIMSCVKNVHKHTDKIYKSFPDSLVLYIVKTFSTKILDSFILTKQMLDNIKKISIQKKQHIQTIVQHTNTPYKDIGFLFKYTSEYTQNKELFSYPNYLYINEQIKYFFYSIAYYIIMYFTYKKNIKDIVEEKKDDSPHLQLKYILTTKDMNYITNISKKLRISESKVLQLFLLKVFGIYFKHYYYTIHEKNCNYIIPYIHDSFTVNTLQSYMMLFLKNNYSQHAFFDLLLKLKQKNGYIFSKKEKYISITELELIENISNIKIDRLFYNTEEKNNPINITFMHINNVFEINVSYASNYDIVKDIFKKLFTIIELYATQKDTSLGRGNI